MLKITINLKNTFYEDKEMLDIMKEFYQIKRNLIIQHNHILSRLVVYKKAYDISQEDRIMPTNPRPISHPSRILRKVKIYTHS